MKILLATHFFPPGHLGGTEVLTLGLAKSLAGSGCQVQVICNEGWDTATGYRIQYTDEIYQEIPVRRLHFNWTKAPDVFRYLYTNPEVYEHFLLYLREYRPDVIHITSLYSLTASLIQASNELKIPIVLTATDFWFVCAKNTLLRKDGSLCPGQEDPWECTRCLLGGTKVFQVIARFLPEKSAKAALMRMSQLPSFTNLPGVRGMTGNWQDRFEVQAISLKQIDEIVTASQFLKDLYIKYGVDPRKIKYSAYGLDTAWARGYSTKTKTENLRIGFIGQIIPMKGTDLLIRAIKELPTSMPIEVKIYGDLQKNPDYGEALQKLTGRDPRVSFLGTFDNSKMGEIMSGIDVLAVPSIWYDFPLVIPSALATNTPVIATDLAGMNEAIVHNQNGLLFKRHDWGELASQIRRLVEENGLLDKLKGGIRPVKTVDEMGEEYLHLYSNLVESRVRKSD